MRSVLILLILFSMPLGRAETAASRPEVAILSNPVLRVAAGLPILLSDIGGVSYVSLAIMQKASNLTILDSLADGEERTLSNVELVKVLKQKFAGNSTIAGLNWTYFVPEKTRIQGVKNLISQDRFSSKILHALNEKCETCSFTLRDLKIPRVKESAQAMEMQLETASLKIAGGFILPVRVRFANSESVYYITGQIAAKNRALVTTRSLRMGEKIETADVKSEEVEVNFSSDAFAELSDLAGKTTGRAIQMGRTLYKSDLKKELVVTRGQSLRAVSGNDAFEVSIQMQAEESGAVGDIVRVKNPETQKLLSGQVIDRGLVRIQ